MIAADTNYLAYAHRGDSPFHARASESIATLANGSAAWAIPWPCLHVFFAFFTYPRIYAPPTPLLLALDQIEAWLESPSLTLLAESSEHWPELRALVEGGQIAGPQVHDARVAALCLEHGVREFWSADRNFSRYPRLRILNPLIA